MSHEELLRSIAQRFSANGRATEWTDIEPRLQRWLARGDKPLVPTNLAHDDCAVYLELANTIFRVPAKRMHSLSNGDLAHQPDRVARESKAIRTTVTALLKNRPLTNPDPRIRDFLLQIGEDCEALLPPTLKSEQILGGDVFGILNEYVQASFQQKVTQTEALGKFLDFQEKALLVGWTLDNTLVIQRS